MPPARGTDDERGFAALLLASGVVITIDELIVHRTLKPSRYFGLVAAFFMLSIVSQFEPDLARAFAWLLFLGLLLIRGPRVLAAVTRQTRRTRR